MTKPPRTEQTAPAVRQPRRKARGLGVVEADQGLGEVLSRFLSSDEKYLAALHAAMAAQNETFTGTTPAGRGGAKARRAEKIAVEDAMRQDIERILNRLDTEMPEAQKRMDDLLTRLRTPRPV
jgi:hypothetical protein